MKSLHLLLLPLAFSWFSAAAQAQPKSAKAAPKQLPKKAAPTQPSASKSAAKKGSAGRIGLDTARMLRLNYGFPKWNKSPIAIDTASVLMREGSTGRIVQIQLEETAPDSSIFTGLYSVQWESISKMAPEFFAPPQELLETTQGLKKIQEMIAKKELKRNPFILRRGPGGSQMVEVFDSKDQARTAMKIYRDERASLELQRQKVVSESALAAAEMAADAAERESAAKAAMERVRIGQVESRKEMDREELFKQLPKAEQAKRKKEAAKLAAEALVAFKASDFPGAQKKFEAAVDLDPTEKGYSFQYGVTLFRNDKNNLSLVFLDLATGKDVNIVERDYYKALNYYKLKEFAHAKETFTKVQDAGNPDMSPSAAFYLGMLLYEDKDYEASKNQFQKVLDISKDPKLDASADAYIETILRLMQFEAERKRKWTLSATLGLNYDSNILQISDSQMDTGTASDTAGYRVLQQGSVKYRPVFSEKKEWATQLDIVNMYTVDDSFQSDDTLHKTDPLLATLIFPYTFKGLVGGKGLKADIVPGYETLYMAVESDTTEEILASYFLNSLNTLVVNENWFSSYNLELRYDTSKLSSSTGDNDSTAFKAKLGFGNMLFVNKEKNKILTADLAYTSNQAKGANVVFDRLDLAVGYIAPAFWDLTYNPKLSYFMLNYTQNANGRSDQSYTASCSLSKKINDTFSSAFLMSYNINQSNVEAYTFKRISGMLTLTAGVGF